MDGWMDGQVMDGREDGWMDGYLMEGWVLEVWINDEGGKDGQMNRWVDDGWNGW